MVDVAFGREPSAARDASTVIVVRDRSSHGEGALAGSAVGAAPGIEVFCVERNKRSAFFGGAVVFPGGKVDDADRDAGWETSGTPPPSSAAPFARDESALRALSVAACRETLEEAAILPLFGGTLTHDELLALRAEASTATLLALLRTRGLKLDLAALVPFARWITPIAEPRRYDTRFFLTLAPQGQPGAHDNHETTASFWASPAAVLARYDAGTAELAPPTHRTLEILSECASAKDALSRARAACLDPICPELVRHVDREGETMALVLPGDPAHSLKEARVPGRSRFVLRGAVWTPTMAP